MATSLFVKYDPRSTGNQNDGLKPEVPLPEIADRIHVKFNGIRIFCRVEEKSGRMLVLSHVRVS